MSLSDWFSAVAGVGLFTGFPLVVRLYIRHHTGAHR